MAKILKDEWNEEAYNNAFNEWNKKAGGRLVFNDLDKQTALKDKNFFTTTAQNKLNYLTAQDNNDAVKMQEANDAQNMTRRQYGFTLGSDGNTPTLYNDPKLDTSISTQKPADYVSKYKNKIDSLYNTIANSKFSYDVNTDPSYQAYKAAYVRDGNRAMQDTLGEALGSSGFAGSSYATTAATQANDYYMSQLNDKVPELYQQAYARYQDELANKNQNLNTLMNLENNDYSRYRDAISDYNNDRNFEWGQKQAQYSADVNTAETKKNDARYEAEKLAEAKAAKAQQEITQQEFELKAQQQGIENAIKWAELYGYGYDPYTGESVNTLDAIKANNDYTLGAWGKQNDATKINNDYNLGLINAENDRTKINNDYTLGVWGKQNEATKINNDYAIGSTNAETNRIKANSEVRTSKVKSINDSIQATIKNAETSTLGVDGKYHTKKLSTTEQQRIAKDIAEKARDNGAINLYELGELYAMYNIEVEEK